MLQTIRQWLRPPIFDQDEARTNAAQVLHFILWVVLITSTVALAYFSTREVNWARNVVSISTMVIITLFSIWRLRLGDVYMVGRFYLVILWCASIGYSLVTRGILSPYPVLQITIILLAAIVIRPSYAVYFALGSAISDTVLLIISDDLPEVARFYTSQQYLGRGVSNWLVYVASYVMTAALVIYTARIIRNNAQHIHKREQELAERNRELIAEIEKRGLVEVGLRQSEEKFRMLTEMALAGIYIFQGMPNPTFVYVNKTLAQMMGYEPDEMINKVTLSEFLPPDQLKLATERIQQRLEGSSLPASHTYMVKRRDGSLFPLEVSATPIEYEGKPALVGTVIDLSAVRQAEQARVELEVERQRIQFLREFVDTMTHDLKTPLTVINSSLYLVGASEDPAGQQKHLNRIAGQVEQMTKMVEDMLTVARLDSIPELNLTDTSINDIIEQAREQMSTKAEQKRLKIIYDLEPELNPILADNDQLYHATTNLIENAINYTPEDGIVTVRTRKAPAEVLIEVTDTGIGIGEDELPHIFNRFFRATNAKNLPGGSGLGLAIVKRIVDLHHGQIDVTSQVEEGTTFRLRFPVSQRDNHAAVN